MAFVGAVAIVLSVAVIAAEIVLRNVFNISIGGVDELGGYALAVGTSLSFAYALMERAHVRVDTLYMHGSPGAKSVLDVLAMAGVAAVALTLAINSSTVWSFAVSFGTRSMTPLQTPMWIPQGLWLLGLWWFALTSLCLLAMLVVLALRGDAAGVKRIGGIGGVSDELAGEIADMEKRGGTR
jgi:TRAP-type C4-dicarboxylate transport system permease small subunit